MSVDCPTGTASDCEAIWYLHIWVVDSAHGCTPDRDSEIAFSGDYNYAAAWESVSTFDISAIGSRGSGDCPYSISFTVTSSQESGFTTSLSFDYAT